MTPQAQERDDVYTQQASSAKATEENEELPMEEGIHYKKRYFFVICVPLCLMTIIKMEFAYS